MDLSALKCLSIDDIRTVMRHPHEDARTIAAQRICRDVRSHVLSSEERVFARKLLAYIAKDSAEMVRRALAVTLRNSSKLPREIALKLAHDVDTVAVPILTNSPVFSDEDLVEILKSKAAAKALAVAKRISVSDHVARAIIRFGDSQAVAEVAANDGALISEETAAEMLSLYHDHDLIAQCMILRRDLPPTIVEKMINLVSEDLAVELTRRHALPVEMAVDIATRTRERAVVDFIDQAWVSKDLQALVKAIDGAGRLTSSLILRAAGTGQMRFTEHALAIRADISLRKAVLMIHDGGPYGLKALCGRAGLSDEISHVLRAACVIYRDLESGAYDYDKDYFQELMIERILTLPFELPEMEQLWFLERLDGLSGLDFTD